MNISVNQFQKTFYYSYWCALKGPQDFVVGLTKNGKLDLKQFVNHDSLIYQSDKNTTIDTYRTSKEVRFTQDPTGTTIYFEVDGWFPINEILEFTKRYPGIVFELSLLFPSTLINIASADESSEKSVCLLSFLDGVIVSNQSPYNYKVNGEYYEAHTDKWINLWRNIKTKRCVSFECLDAVEFPSPQLEGYFVF